MDDETIGMEVELGRGGRRMNILLILGRLMRGIMSPKADGRSITHHILHNQLQLSVYFMSFDIETAGESGNCSDLC